MKKIRVLHVLYAMNYAGTETLLMNLYRHINRNKIQFDFAVCTEDKCDYESEIQALGGKVIHYPKYTVLNHSNYRKWWKTFFEEHDEYKIVHGHIGSTAAIYLSIAKEYGCYTIAHSHNTYSRKINVKDIVYRVYSYPTRFIADYFMGCSNKALRERYGGKVADNVNISKVFFNAIDVEKFNFDECIRKEVRQEYGIAQDSVVLGTVGRLTAQKNPFMLLRIIERLKNEGVDFTFMWFGKGDLEKQIQHSIEHLGLEHTIIMGGVRGDINRVLQAMDAFIFPSIYEGLGIVCVEAQAADLECFCSNSIPNEARVTERFNAIALNDVEAWVEGIKTYIEQIHDSSRKSRADELKEAGYDVVTQAEWLEHFYITAFNSRNGRKNGDIYK